ncbi:hypothetical protein ACFL1H_03115 [Nanoarchaeota archaeon]
MTLEEIFPIRSDKRYINGPFEVVLRLGGLIGGISAGLIIGDNIVNYASQISENATTIDHFVKNNQFITYFLSASTGANIFYRLGGFTGGLLDLLMGSHYPDPKC